MSVFLGRTNMLTLLCPDAFCKGITASVHDDAHLRRSTWTAGYQRSQVI